MEVNGESTDLSQGGFKLLNIVWVIVRDSVVLRVSVGKMSRPISGSQKLSELHSL